ncbi:His-Xaa-Ser system protein HxsD [Herbaspirillum huttiense]|uniref:His-Xaa-Ser system protein HxsD n=1 Tax=Herbaspirillum huttiense TaxID=863372 RepID=UPI000585B0C2|nr:His-Xaa-Ser system protein HxsD [Herbaspirillum huttiense]
MTVTTLKFDAEIYSVLAIEKGCYRLSDVLSSVIAKDGNDFLVEITFLGKGKTTEGMDATLARLKNEILDQNLREKIKVETAATRNLILAYAFSRTGLISNDSAKVHE